MSEQVAPGALAFPEAPIHLLPLLTGKRGHKLRAAIGYEPNVPRCDNCMHFRQQRTVLLNSMPHWQPPRCVKHRLRVEQHGLCNTWQSKTGEVLVP